jgi:hypothetical protein
MRPTDWASVVGRELPEVQRKNKFSEAGQLPAIPSTQKNHGLCPKKEMGAVTTVTAPTPNTRLQRLFRSRAPAEAERGRGFVKLALDRIESATVVEPKNLVSEV